jgi:two-component system nitrogen regulation response regulator NtrX
MAKILVVDDELSIRKALTFSLSDDGYSVTEADSKSSALERLREQNFDLVITDLFLPIETDGLEILQTCKAGQPETMVIIMTAHSSIERAVEAVKAGADDFIAKGFVMEELKLRLGKLLEQKRLREENRRLAENYNHLRQEIESRYRFEQIIGNSKAVRDLLQLLSRIVDDRDTTVLLQGESGTGKELVARAIHYNGPRQDKPFVIVNCAALPEHLLESELFGYEKGAFTGALRDKPGKFEIAEGGTVFLDEIGDISPKVQVELLRFTQDRTFERVGGNQPITVDVRIIAATNKQLDEEVKQNRFRADLFYRLNVIPVFVPPLRERKEDVPLLINHFVEKFRREKNRDIRFSPEALLRLEKHHWPGNVRELENLIERLVVTAPQATILPTDLPPEIFGHSEKEAFDSALSQHSLQEACEEFEKLFLLRHLEKHHWNITEVAQALRERRDTLSRKIKRYGLKAE